MMRIISGEKKQVLNTCFTYLYVMANAKILQGVDVSNFVGEWVIVCDNKVVAHNKDLTKISSDIDSCKTTPTVAKIPKEEILIF